MFDDGPPPLPPVTTASPLDGDSMGSIFADLDDGDRLTAVADHEYSNYRIDDSLLPSPPDDLPPPKFPSRTSIIGTKGNGITAESIQQQFDPDNASANTDITTHMRSQEAAEGVSLVVAETVTTTTTNITTTITVSSNADVNAKAAITEQHSPIYDTDNNAMSERINFQTMTIEHEIPNCITKTDIMITHADTSSARDNIKAGPDDEQLSIAQETTANTAMVPDDSEFGDFSEFVGADNAYIQLKKQKMDEDWASFDDGSTVRNFEQSEHTESSQAIEETKVLSSLENAYCDDTVWLDKSANNATYEEDDNASMIDNNDIYQTLNELQKKKENSRPWQSTWLAVGIIEETLALKMHWEDSSAKKEFLKSLNIDADLTAVRNSGLPAFAQQLDDGTILAPTAVANARNVENDRKIDSKKSLEEATRIQPTRTVELDSLAVPPAQFDWNNSGLINPLTAGTIKTSSALLDLDFLVTSSLSNSSNDSLPSATSVYSTLQKDLAAFGLNTANDVEKNKEMKSSEKANKSLLLENLIKKADNERKYTPISELSLDARALHDQLPDLDYINSNVLLFPVINR